MVLAQWLLKSRPYFDFYQALMDQGDDIIMDNGAYEEEQVSQEQLLALTQEFEPDYVILPDTPHDLAQTVLKSERFVQAYLGPTELIMVIHAEEGKLKDFEAMYEIGCTLADGVAFSRLTQNYRWPTPNKTYSQFMRRADFIEHLKREHLWQDDKYHHCLGMLNGALQELPMLSRLGVDSIDSSAPVWRGLHGYPIDGVGWPDYSLQMDSPVEFSAAQISLAAANLDQALTACQSK